MYVYFVTALKHLKCIDKIYSHNGFMVLCNDKVVCISNETGSEVSSHFPHSISLVDVRTHDMKLFVTRSQDNILRVWDITREDVQNKLPQQSNSIRSQSYCNLIYVYNEQFLWLHQNFHNWCFTFHTRSNYVVIKFIPIEYFCVYIHLLVIRYFNTDHRIRL